MFLGLLRQTVMITSLVLVMMLIIEYFNVLSSGRWSSNIVNSKFKQVFISALLGLIPGCVGGFAVVSMFTHNVVNFGALIASMIASSGDESFVIFSMMPKTALILNAVLFVIAMVAGLLINLFVKSAPVPVVSKNHMVIHSHEVQKGRNSWEEIKSNIKAITFPRAVLIFGLLLFLLGVFTGQFEHGGLSLPHFGTHHIEEGHEGGGIETYLFGGLIVFALYILLVVDNHFLEEHLWEHIIKKHFLRVFLWTLGALAGIEILLHYVDFAPWLEKNQLMVLLAALLIGIIPESGPNLIFVTLFYNGTIPFSIFLANSVVQDGHSALPLLAESKRSFIWVKGINLFIGALFGLAGYLMHW